jgi:hypothetical protein
MLAALVTHLDGDTNRHSLARAPFRGWGFLCHTLVEFTPVFGGLLDSGADIQERRKSGVLRIDSLVTNISLIRAFQNRRVYQKNRQLFELK